MIDLLPWHHQFWKNLNERKERGQLPHALMFTGPGGIGKNQFADLFARGLLCKQPTPAGFPCGECRGCQLTQAQTHPDIRWVMPPVEEEEEAISADQIREIPRRNRNFGTITKGKVIGVDQIREIIRFLSLKSQYGGYKLVIISPADKMNINAANSLLKTLEEPPAETVLILITERPARLPATIRSRCQKISFTKPSTEIALDWIRDKLDRQHEPSLYLELAEGAPLSALKIAAGDYLGQRMALLGDMEKITGGKSDPVLIAGKWLKFGAKESLYWVYSWLVDMVRMKMADHPPLVGNPDIRERLLEMAQNQSTTQLFGRLDRVTRALQLSDTQVNGQLLLEEIFLGWAPRQG